MSTVKQTLGTALVTGASTGIGATYADRLARRGYDLVLVVRNRERLEQLAARLASETGVKTEVLVADLTVHADLAPVERRLAEDAAITLLVNNAGVPSGGALATAPADQLEAMIQLNVLALTRLTRAVLPRFLAQGRGAIINLSSVVALAPELIGGGYSATKAFVLAFTQALHDEVGGRGVQVQAVLPGVTRTELWDHAGIDVATLPAVMEVGEMVDGALAGFDQGELVTIPALPNLEDWRAFDAARRRLGPNLSRDHAADRYRRRAIPANAP
jgi:short-subunit dehydrogenase